MPGYCTPEDVRKVLQERELDATDSGPLDTTIVKATIEGMSDWLRRRSHHHWYDSTADTDTDSTNDFLFTAPRTASAVCLDVPSSPHRQDRQLVSDDPGVRYPVTQSGPYAKIRLPRYDVQSLATLEVRNRGGGVTDWVAATDKTDGRGEDYYLQADGRSEYGTTYLYVRAASIGPRVDFDDLLTVEFDYGADAQDDDWQSVRRGVAALSGADLGMDDDVKTAIPSDGQLITVETKADRLINQALRLLDPYLERPGK